MNRDGRAPVAVFERLRGQRSQPAWRLRPFNSAGLGNEVFFCREIRAQPVYPPRRRQRVPGGDVPFFTFCPADPFAGRVASRFGG